MSSDKRTRITKDSESSARRALIRYLRCIGEDRTVGRSTRRYSARWASIRCTDRHMRTGLFEFYRLRKNPRRRTFHRVFEHPEGLNKRSLEERIDRRHPNSPSEGERKKDKFSLEVEAIGKA